MFCVTLLGFPDGGCLFKKGVYIEALNPYREYSVKFLTVLDQ